LPMRRCGRKRPSIRSSSSKTARADRSRLRGAAGAQEGRGLLEGELLTGHSGDEVPTTDQAAGLEPAQRPEDLPPWKRKPFLQVDVAKYHAPAQQELRGDRFGQLLDLLDRLSRRQQGPAPLDPLPPGAAPA